MRIVDLTTFSPENGRGVKRTKIAVQTDASKFTGECIGTIEVVNTSRGGASADSRRKDRSVLL